MASIVVNGEMKTTNDATIGRFVDDKPVTVELTTGEYKILSPDKAKNYPTDVVRTIDKNQSDIEQGASYSDFNTRKKYLDMELPHINNFLTRFRFNDSSIKTVIEWDDTNYNWIRIDNFPLPDDYNPDYEKISIVTADYPNFGPVGIYVPDTSRNKARIIEKMGGHLFSREDYNRFSHIPLFDLPGWTWVCYHYKDFRWNFNRNNVMQGDNLTKFIKAVHANLSGNYDV